MRSEEATTDRKEVPKHKQRRTPGRKVPRCHHMRPLSVSFPKLDPLPAQLQGLLPTVSVQGPHSP